MPPEPQNFTGRVRMQNLAAAGGTSELEYFAVYFDAGAHTRPHTHATDQVLCFVRGTGFVWIAGEERQPVEKRGVVVIPAGVLHMHGARKTSRSATSPSARRARPTGARRFRTSGSSTCGSTCTMGPCSARPWTTSSRS